MSLRAISAFTFLPLPNVGKATRLAHPAWVCVLQQLTIQLNARDEVVAQGSDISVNGDKVKVSVFHGYAHRGRSHRHAHTYQHPYTRLHNVKFLT